MLNSPGEAGKLQREEEQWGTQRENSCYGLVWFSGDVAITSVVLVTAMILPSSDPDASKLLPVSRSMDLDLLICPEAWRLYFVCQYVDLSPHSPGNL